MANIALLLEESGAKLEDIVKIVVYLTDIRYREPVYRVMGQLAEGRLPGVDRPRGHGARAARVGRRDRRDGVIPEERA